MWTAWLVVSGSGEPRTTGELARFGAGLFQVLAPLQMGLAVLFSALLAASAVAKEKDRRTLVLLLMTNLSNVELVLGKLMASLLGVLVMVAAAIPCFLLIVLLGGVSFQQVFRVFAVTAIGAIAAGSLGSTIALWREKTFQSLAMTALVLFAWTAAWEAVGAGVAGEAWGGISTSGLAAACSPWQAILVASAPVLEGSPGIGWLLGPGAPFLAVTVALAVALNAVAVWRLRVWNPVREVQRDQRTAARAAGAGSASGDSQRASDVHRAPGKARPVWDNAVLWREVRTWAYGHKVIVIRIAYVGLAVLAGWWLHWIVDSTNPWLASRAVIPPVARPLAPLLVLSWVLVNALAVTSITNERDARTLDLMLATDLSPKEIIFGKLGGVLYNSKEMVVAPMLLCAYAWSVGAVSTESLVFLILGLALMAAFVAMLGIHVGMTYSNSRTAVGVSLGVVLFLFIGVATCMRIILAFSGSFQVQLQPFLAFMLGGGIGLYSVLGARNPSPAIAIASFTTPLATFYIITSFVLRDPLAVFLVTMATYGFATVAMLIPAISEFDVATGRTTAGED
jgi:ABC-type transport system involved in multi-copper enzyme maturation permease subunit